MKKIISTLMITTMILPFSVLAQTVSAPIDTQTPLPVPIQTDSNIVIDVYASPDIVQVTDPNQLSISPQDTGTDQQTTQGSVIESTFDPNQTGSSTTPVVSVEPDPIPVETPPTTSPGIETIVDVVTPDPSPVVISVSPGDVSARVAVIDNKELTPKDKFVFNIEGPATATKDDPKSQKQILITPNLVPDNVSGELDISGTCSEAYFVVLLYKEKEDYNKNPVSYIFNKAFDCLNGSYKYSINEIPSNLPDGTYYLLIGGQGETGTWRPITALTPITIQKTDDNQ